MKITAKETKICEVCGKEFVPVNSNCKVCSEECRKIHRRAYRDKINEQNRQKTRERLGTRICVVCGREFEPPSPINVTCSPECQIERNKVSIKAWRTKKENEQEAVVEKKKRTHEENVKEMIDLNGKAHAKGMSYGQYVAYLEMQKAIKARKARKARGH